jgi:nucleoside-diphosphate-sugar epimerase
MKVLVTGSAGFIGRAVCDLLQRQGWQVTGLDMQRHELSSGQFVQCDIREGAALRRAVVAAAPEVIIHLAARIDLLERHDLTGYSANIEGVENLIEAVKATPGCRRVIYTSSQLVCRPGYVPAGPEDYCPHTIYGRSKVRTEQIVRERASEAGEWCLVRPTTVWGPGMSPHYQTMLRLIRQGRYFHCGSSPLLKSYSYLGNIAWQYYQLAKAPAGHIQGQTFYLADYQPLSLRRYADDLANHLGAPRIRTYPLPMVRILARMGDVLNAAGWRRFPFNTFRLNNILTEYVFDTSATEKVCGPLPCTYEEGVAATADWFRIGANKS